MASDDFKLINYNQVKERAEHYEKMFKKILKSIPKTILIQNLVELKILKEDYLTKEVNLKSKKVITCRLCGFTTYDFQDMIEHLAQSKSDGRIPEENCNKKILIFKYLKGEKGE